MSAVRVMGEIIQQMGQRCALDYDLLVERHIRARLGYVLRLEAMLGRVMRTCAPRGIETWFVDGQPVLELHPIQVVERRDHHLEVARRWRSL